MDTLTQQSGFQSAQGEQPEQFLPPESPLPVSRQELHDFQHREEMTKDATSPVGFRRACIFGGTAAMTFAGCYEMYQVLQVGGVTFLEWMVLVLFVLLFDLDC